MANQNALERLVREVPAIPFDKPCGPGFKLLSALDVQPSPASGMAPFVPLQAGFDEELFNNLEVPERIEGLKKLLTQCSTDQFADLKGLRKSHRASSGEGALDILGLCEASGKGSSSSVDEEIYSITNIKARHFMRTPLIVPFVKENMSYILKVGALSSLFDATPTVSQGSVDKVIAFVSTEVTGEVERYSRTGRTQQAGASVGVGASAGAGVAQVVSASAGFDHESSDVALEQKAGGIIGVAVLLVHLCKTHSSNGVYMKHHEFVSNEHHPSIVRFLRRAKLKMPRSLLFGRPKAPLGFLTEANSTMQEFASLDEHMGVVKSGVQSLATGVVDDGKIYVNLKCQDEGAAMPLDNHQRLEDSSDVGSLFRGSFNIIYTSEREVLSSMFQELKKKGFIQFMGRRVVAMSPAIHVRTNSFLPLYLQIGTWEGEAPGAIVREYDKDHVFVFPVEGPSTNLKNCVTIYHDSWEVRESTVRVSSNDADGIRAYEEKGFFKIENDDEQDGEQDDTVVLARQILALKYDDDLTESQPSIFRSPPPNASAKHESPDLSNATPSLQSSTEDSIRPTKQQKTK